MPGCIGWVQPLHGENTRLRRCSSPDLADRVDALTHVIDEMGRAVGDARRRADLLNRVENLRKCLRLDGQDDPLRRGRLVEAAHRSRDLLVANRAHVAQFLGDDEVRVALLEQRVVEDVEAAAAVRGRSDMLVDIVTRQRLGRKRAARDPRDRLSTVWQLALMCHRHEVALESKRHENVRCSHAVVTALRSG